LADRLGENVAAIRYEFDDYCVSEIGSEDLSPADWRIEPWPEPVATAALLQELINKINKHVVLRPHEALTVALWTLAAWVHNRIAHHSPYLVATSADDSAGKTTLIIETVGRLAPKAYNVGEPTAAIFRFIDREKPSLSWTTLTCCSSASVTSPTFSTSPGPAVSKSPDRSRVTPSGSIRSAQRQ
jgi:hypothetical protein